MNKKKLIKFFSLFFCAILLIGINVVLSIGLTSCVKKSNNKTNITLENTCTITFNANGGTGSMTKVEKHEGDELILPKCTFTKANYKFVGWSRTSNGEVTYNDEDRIRIYSNFTLYAIWDEIKDITLTYKSNVASGEYSETISPGSYMLPGYEFIAERFEPTLEYEYLSSFTINGTNYNFCDMVDFEEDTEIFVNTSCNYTIRAFIAESSTGSYSNVEYFDVEISSYENIEYVSLPSLEFAKLNGLIVPELKKFVGWGVLNTNLEEGYEKLQFNTFKNLARNGFIYLYPVFAPANMTLSIRALASDDTFTGEEFEISIPYGTEYTLNDPSKYGYKITTEGYYFSHYINLDDSNIYDINSKITVTNDLVLYVKASNIYHFNFCCMRCDECVKVEVTYGEEYQFQSGSLLYQLGTHVDSNEISHNSVLETGMNFKFWTTHKLYDDIEDKIYQDTVITVNKDWILDKETKSTTFYPVVGGKRTKFNYHNTNGDVSKQISVDTGDIYIIAWSEEVENEAFDSYNSRLAGWSFTPNSLEPDYLVSEKILVKYEMDGEIDLYPVFKTALIGVVKSSNASTNLVVIENTRYPITVDMDLTFIDPDTGNSYSTTVKKIEVNGVSTSSSIIGDTVYLTLNTTFSGSITDYFLATLKGDGVAVNKVTKAKVTFVDPSYEEYFSNSSVYCFRLNGCDCTKKEFYSFEVKEATKTEDGLFISFDIKQQLIVSYYDEIYIYCEEVYDGPFAIITEIECEFPSIIIF